LFVVALLVLSVCRCLSFCQCLFWVTIWICRYTLHHRKCSLPYGKSAAACYQSPLQPGGHCHKRYFFSFFLLRSQEAMRLPEPDLDDAYHATFSGSILVTCHVLCSDVDVVLFHQTIRFLSIISLACGHLVSEVTWYVYMVESCCSYVSVYTYIWGAILRQVRPFCDTLMISYVDIKKH
jgi:hypothetical protein